MKKQGTGVREQGTGTLARVWATAEMRQPGRWGRSVRRRCGAARASAVDARAPQRVAAPAVTERVRCRARIAVAAAAAREPVPQVVEQNAAFYRRYTEALLRRYVRLSFEAGRTPSLLGKELFRAKVSSHRMSSFEDVVIFCHDVDRCLERMGADDQAVLARIGLEEHSQGDAAAALGWTLAATVRRYNAALDRLTAQLLRLGMLERAKCCQ